MLAVFLGGHAGILFELAQESVDVADADHTADIPDLVVRVAQQVNGFLHTVKLDVVAQVGAGLSLKIGGKIVFEMFFRLYFREIVEKVSLFFKPDLSAPPKENLNFSPRALRLPLL